MAPNRLTAAATTTASSRTGIMTRNQKAISTIIKPENPDQKVKRKADSPLKDKPAKRSALGNITNALGKTVGIQDVKKPTKKSILSPLKQNLALERTAVDKSKLDLKTKVLNNKIIKIAGKKIEVKNVVITKTKQSTEIEKSNDSSLYVSAEEDVIIESSKTLDDNLETVKQISRNEETKENVNESIVVKDKLNQCVNRIPVRSLPSGVEWDFDVENWNDVYQVSHYSMEIFEYLKSRECLFPIGDYMERQVCLSKWMRSLLVDWMVEVQESFELNHETLYLAVKLVDLYLTKVTVSKEMLQLLGAASLFIASKFDERIPPMVEDFLYICDGAYTQRALIRMEINVLKIVDFDLGIPLSYRFLRRYARCGKVTMPTLTLARYILEYSLMDYSTIHYSDSKIAAAALLLALQMKDLGNWTPTLEYYTGYKIDDIRHIVYALNLVLHKKPKEALATVRNKYSHKIFFEVAKVSLKEHLDI